MDSAGHELGQAVIPIAVGWRNESSRLLGHERLALQDSAATGSGLYSSLPPPQPQSLADRALTGSSVPSVPSQLQMDTSSPPALRRLNTSQSISFKNWHPLSLWQRAGGSGVGGGPKLQSSGRRVRVPLASGGVFRGWLSVDVHVRILSESSTYN